MKAQRFANEPASPPLGQRFIYGVHPIAAWLETSASHLRTLYHASDLGGRGLALVGQARTNGIDAQARSRAQLETMAGTPHHQGLVAACTGFPYSDLAQILDQGADLLVAADQLQDPQNLGALIRTAEAVGAGAVILPKDHSAAVSASVEMAAAGAAARIRVTRVTNLARSLEVIKQRGYWVVGLAPREGSSLFELDPPSRIVLVVGGEMGMRPLVARQCDFTITIPMFGRSESLNAGVAAAVALYQVRRVWGERQKTMSPPK
jgi:23S rRNA (guanosine2251-2'-O)-methyltransferase